MDQVTIGLILLFILAILWGMTTVYKSRRQ